MTFQTTLCGLGAALFPSLLMAATLTITVKDPSGALVGGAAVTLTPPSGPALPQKRTDVQGRAVFDGLSAGAYRVSVAKQSFDEYQGQVKVGAQPASLTVSLKISALTTSVKVSGGRSPLANSDPNYIALRNSKLGQVRQVENFTLTRDAGTFTFRSGSFSFEPAVMGRLTVAAFVGEGNFHLKPAFNLAAQHLHRMMGADEVSEDFTALVIYFTDSTADEIKQHSVEADESAQKQQQALKRVNAILQTRRVQQPVLYSSPKLGLPVPATVSHPLTQLERLLNYQDIPNYDAEVLTELYNHEKPGSFRAFIHGKKHADLRFLVNPHGALPVLQTPEEVALMNFDPASNATASHDSDGLWYLSHTVAEVEAGRESSTEEKRLIAPDHYKIDSFIRGENLLGNRPDLQVVCAMRFHALQDGVRMVKFDLVPDLGVQHLRFNGVEIPFVQESRGHDGSFYLQMPEPLMTGRSYDVTFEYKGGEILQSERGGVPLVPDSFRSRQPRHLRPHVPHSARRYHRGRRQTHKPVARRGLQRIRVGNRCPHRAGRVSHARTTGLSRNPHRNRRNHRHADDRVHRFLRSEPTRAVAALHSRPNRPVAPPLRQLVRPVALRPPVGGRGYGWFASGPGLCLDPGSRRVLGRGSGRRAPERSQHDRRILPGPARPPVVGQPAHPGNLSR
jgi:hypothetical protein